MIIEDVAPWVKYRRGFSYGATRKDLVLLKDGCPQNAPIFNYYSNESNPLFYYCEVSSRKKIIENVLIERSEDSSYKTFCFLIENQHNVTLRNIHVITPQSSLYGDNAISIRNSSQTFLDNIDINGTYSQVNEYGYGVGLNNVLNTNIINMNAVANWGVFGNFNVNTVYLKNCRINRFDIHCYGKDVQFTDCVIYGLYNQYSSVYGTISHNNCIFDNAVPCLIEGSYNAYTPFNLQFENCIFKLNQDKNYIVSIYGLSNEINGREELSSKCLPNVYINRCHVIFESPVKEWYLFRANDNLAHTEKIYFLSQIIIKKLTLSSRLVKFKPFNVELLISNQLKQY